MKETTTKIEEVTTGTEAKGNCEHGPLVPWRSMESRDGKRKLCFDTNKLEFTFEGKTAAIKFGLDKLVKWFGVMNILMLVDIVDIALRAKYGDHQHFPLSPYEYIDTHKVIDDEDNPFSF